tara:strand:+ start:1444 stop:2376 length:933 start_codon:yes stop_codon:yes gene_type:complete
MRIIAGVDEVGRGPLAGPVVAAAVILPKDHTIEGLRDSKKISKKRRESLFPLIYEQAIDIGTGEVDVKTIDKINIREATFKAMKMALDDLSTIPDRALIDGHPLNDQSIPNEGIIGGDDKVDSIKAASIIAKVTRDRIMKEYSIIFPEYGFENHSGYGTKIHIEALEKYRATPIHRRSFKPVKNLMPTFKWLVDHDRISWMGKKLAALHLKKSGMSVMDLDWEGISNNSIDIVAKDNDHLIFVDVNTYYKNQDDLKKDNEVDRLKKTMLPAMNLYLSDKLAVSNFRIDSISVILSSNNPEILHNKDIKID